MIIKKLVVGSMFSMLLGSEMAAADWGDVYYCEMTQSYGITLEGEKINHTLEEFQFKLDGTEMAMVFGSTGFFGNSVSKLGDNWPSQEMWFATTKYSTTYFEEGKLLSTNNTSMGAIALSADCDKF